MTTTEFAPAAPPPARIRGRPRKIDGAKRRKICVLVSIGCDLRQAPFYAGCRIPRSAAKPCGIPNFDTDSAKPLKMKAEINARSSVE